MWLAPNQNIKTSILNFLKQKLGKFYLEEKKRRRDKKL